MLFNSPSFWVFFSLFFALYAAFNHRWQNRLLLAASYVFYGWWDYRFVLLMLVSTVFDYFAGLLIAASAEHKIRRRWLIFSMVGNLGLLCFFKYFNFFIASAQALLHTLGFQSDPWVLSIILPIGISFYTFQSMSYTIDVYRNEIKPTRRFLDFALAVSFFPHLVAGPIMRASMLLPQIERPRRMTWDGWCRGWVLIVIGLFKKVCIADVVSGSADMVFAHPEQCSWPVLLFGLYCFALQIYADFSGYTDIARGVARLIDFELPENFNQPYFAANITDFWRRWHISLSTWLRDYLYIPLGGNRHGTWKTYRNLFLTMLLGGLWHGASWTFVVWGGLHGVYLAVHKLMLDTARVRQAADEVAAKPEPVVKFAVQRMNAPGGRPAAQVEEPVEEAA
jgi:alginate O-acetyltransferase complex protein AlgI